MVPRSVSSTACLPFISSSVSGVVKNTGAAGLGGRTGCRGAGRCCAETAATVNAMISAVPRQVSDFLYTASLPSSFLIFVVPDLLAAALLALCREGAAGESRDVHAALQPVAAFRRPRISAGEPRSLHVDRE